MSPGSDPSVPCWDHERAAQWSEMHAHLASEEKTPERSARQRGARRELYGQRRAEDAKNAACQKSETVLCYPPCHFHLSEMPAIAPSSRNSLSARLLPSLTCVVFRYLLTASP